VAWHPQAPPAERASSPLPPVRALWGPIAAERLIETTSLDLGWCARETARLRLANTLLEIARRGGRDLGHTKAAATQHETLSRNPMSLSPVAQPAHETIRGVKFAMLDGTVLVFVLVAHAALQSIEWSPPGSGDYLARFEKHRAKLEGVASKKHDRGQIEENGSVLVQREDLKASWQ